MFGINLFPPMKFAAQPHLDAAENVFFQRQLEEIDALARDVKYAKLKGRMFIPTKPLGAATETYTYRQFDKRAKPAPMQDHSDDLPLVNVHGSEFSFPLRSFGLAFGYTRDEIAAAAMGGVPLDTMRATACREGLAQYIDAVCAVGDSTFGLKGLLTLANTEVYTTPAGAAGGKNWFWTNKKTPDEIIADLNGMKRQVIVNSKEIESPTRLILATALHEYISNTARASVSDTTILKFWSMNNPDVEITRWERCAGAGTSTSNRTVMYDPSVLNLSLLMAIEYEQLAPQFKNFTSVVNARVKTGGVVAPYPKSVIYGDEM
jgi:hypothetical protein